MPWTAPPLAKPSKSTFDPFNSSSTGHQRAENRLGGSISWRDSRTLKLNEQFSSCAGGGKRINDTVGAGSLTFGQDGRTENGGWERGAKGLRGNGQRSIQEAFPKVKPGEAKGSSSKRVKTHHNLHGPTTVVNPFAPFRKEDGQIRETSWTSHESSPSHTLLPFGGNQHDALESDETLGDREVPQEVCPQIFANLGFYINGSTAPAISDHKLKRIIMNHGGRISITLGRRKITHVIVGRSVARGGSGGGLAGSKLHKEITRTGGIALKFVTADWIIDSVAAGKRLPESRYEALKLAPKGVNSIAGILGKRQSSNPG